MGRSRYALVLLVVSSLVLPGWSAGHAQTADNESECSLGSQVAVHGRDADGRIATYTLIATWCIERTFSTTTEEVPEDTSSSSSSASSPSPSPGGIATATALAALEKGTEPQYEAAGKKKKKKRRGRRNKRTTNKGSKGQRSTSVERRRLVSTCMTNFKLELVPTGIDDGVDFLSATTKETTTNGCTAHSFQIQGRFGQDYVRGFPSSRRNVISQSIAGTTFENYPLGRVGYFDITAQFNRDGPPSCTQCVTEFEFCDLRIFDTDTPSDDTCIRLE